MNFVIKIVATVVTSLTSCLREINWCDLFNFSRIKVVGIFYRSFKVNSVLLHLNLFVLEALINVT